MIASSIKVLELPGLPPKGDVSDWLAAGGTAEQLAEIVAAAPTWEPSEASPEEIDKPERGPVAQYADLICADNRFARDAGGKLYRYRDGAYRSKGEAFIQRDVKRLVNSLDDTKRWSSRFSLEVVEYIRVDATELWERPPGDVVSVANGLLQLRTGNLLPHSESYLSPVQLPVKFDPAASCPAIEQFVGDVFPPDAVSLAWEIPALMMAPDPSVQKAVLLLGAGGNGKSTWLAMLTEFLGKVNTAAVSLHRLESDRFSSARLIGKLANICADLPSEHLAGTSTFKALTGGDAIEAEHKFRDSFSFEPFARLVFSANSPPRSSDGSDGFFDRWLVVPFDARFRGTRREISRKELDARLSSPGELSGLLNKALAAWQEIQRRGGRLSEPESVKAAWAEFHAMTDPLSVWLDQFTVEDPEAMVPRTTLRAAYGAACEQAGRPSPTETSFGRAMKKARPNVLSAQRTLNGRMQWSYVGIGLRDAGFYSQRGSQGSQGPSTSCHAGKSDSQGKGGDLEGDWKQVGANPVNPVNPVECDPPHSANGERVRITL